jgi:signal transduction histidine kinase
MSVALGRSAAGPRGDEPVSSVLVVDDRHSDRELTATVLTEAGYRVLRAPSGPAGLELARSECPDLVITDILMPKMNGYEFVRELREDDDLSHVAVIFSTANYIEKEMRRLADACGVTHFLPKPCDPDVIIRTVGEVLGTERATVAPLDTADFEREQRRLINDKFVQKINELEAACAEREQLVGQILTAHEDARRRIAQQLHDDPIQTIAAAGLRLEMLLRQLESPDDRAAVERIQATMSSAVEGLRSMVFALVPGELETRGLAAALEVYLEHGLAGDGVQTALEDRTTREAPVPTRTLLYRMAQEALSNVARHASASTVEVTLLERDGDFSVRIADDGCGFDPEQAMRFRPGHLGLASIRERVALAGGSLLVRSSPGTGATVDITLPERLGRRSAAFDQPLRGAGPASS